MRTDYCGNITAEHNGQTVTLSGWVNKRRDLGGVIFLDLRDREGVVQVVFDPDVDSVFNAANKVRNEFCVKITGLVRPRPVGQVNADMKTGEIEWTTDCGINMGVSVTPQRLSDGRDVVVTGRGGGHGPPEKPNGISLVDLANGATLWTLPLKNFNATMSFGIYKDQVHLFHGTNHISVDTADGKIVKQTSLVDSVSVCRWQSGNSRCSLENLKKSKTRNITQGSNLLVGKWNYFRNYQFPLIGRVNVDTGLVEYLEMPIQLSRASGQKDNLLWFDPKQKKIETQTVVPNDMTNSRGFVVYGDKRSTGSGWGHVAAPSPTVSGDNLYVPVMNGTVYVLDWNKETFDDDSIVAINDLGPAGQAYTRGSLSFSNGCVFAHTLRELICIGN